LGHDDAKVQADHARRAVRVEACWKLFSVKWTTMVLHSLQFNGRHVKRLARAGAEPPLTAGVIEEDAHADRDARGTG